MLCIALAVLTWVVAAQRCGSFCQQARRLPPSSFRILFESTNETSSFDPTDVLHELALRPEVKLAVQRSCTEQGAVLHRTEILSSAAATTLRRVLDRELNREGASNNSEHRLLWSRSELDAAIGPSATTALWSLPDEFLARHREGVLSEGGVDVQADIKLDTAVVWLKRYAASGRPFNELHTDSSALTINVALSSDDDCEGGVLLVCHGGALRAVRRRAGDATVHGDATLHGVTAVTAGERHSLLVFIGRESLVPALLRLDTTARRAEALALIELLADGESLERHCLDTFGRQAMDSLRERSLATFVPLRTHPSEHALRQLGISIEAGLQQASTSHAAPGLRPSALLRAKLDAMNVLRDDDAYGATTAAN